MALNMERLINLYLSLCMMFFVEVELHIDKLLEIY